MVEWFIENFRVISLASAAIPMAAFLILRREKIEYYSNNLADLIFIGLAIPSGVLLVLLAANPEIVRKIKDVPIEFGAVGLFLLGWAGAKIWVIFRTNS